MRVLMALAITVFGGFFGNHISGNQTISPSQVIEVQATPEPTPEATACPIPPSRKDIEDALDFVGDIFDPTLWIVIANTGLDPMGTYVTWKSDTLSAEADLEFWHYDCGVKQDIDQFLASEPIPIDFLGYGSYQQINQCKGDNLRLTEFHLITKDREDYHAFYWITQVSPTRMATLTLIFPYSELLKESVYDLQLFPMLPACPPLGQ